MAYRNHRDLVVWKKSFELCRLIYVITKSFPHHELYGLISQMQRSAVSVPSNIAEGYGRDSDNEFLRFLKIAAGSAYELDTQLEIALDINYLTQEQYDELMGLNAEVMKLLYALRKAIATRIAKSNTEL